MPRIIFVADTDEKARGRIEPYFNAVLTENAKHRKRASAAVAPPLSQLDPNRTFGGTIQSGAIIAGC